MTDSGGVGGLLMIQSDRNTYLPAYDAMGNLHAPMTAGSVTLGSTSYNAGDIVAAHEYDAFGRTLRESGAYAGLNPFRFSTKYTDVETDLVYYGHRYYAPTLGRFINRDPKEEQGGVNLYTFVLNNPINSWDYLGFVQMLSQAMFGEGDPARYSSAANLDAEYHALDQLVWNMGVANSRKEAERAWSDPNSTFQVTQADGRVVTAKGSELASLGVAITAVGKWTSRDSSATRQLSVDAGMSALPAYSISEGIHAYNSLIGTYSSIADSLPNERSVAPNSTTTSHHADQSIWADAGAAALDSGGRYAGAVVEVFKFWKWPQNLADFAGSNLAAGIYDTKNYFGWDNNVAALKQQFGTAEGWGGMLGAGLVGAVAPQVPNVQLPTVTVSPTARLIIINTVDALSDGTILGRLPDPRTVTPPVPPPVIIQVIETKPPAGAGPGGKGPG